MILVTGGIGMLGTALVTVARETVIALSKEALNVCDRVQVENALERYKPTGVINAAGIVRGREVSPAAMIAVNGLGAATVAEECKARGIRSIQVSTDCVFAGTKPYPGYYVEGDTPDPTDVYGISKRAGECHADLTVRTSFVGWGERGLLHWLTNSTGTVYGYTDHLWSGLSSYAVARNLLRLANMPEVTGILHVAGPMMSKWELLVALNGALGLGLEVEPLPSVLPVTRNLWLGTSRPDVRWKLECPLLQTWVSELANNRPAEVGRVQCAE